MIHWLKRFVTKTNKHADKDGQEDPVENERLRKENDERIRNGIKQRQHDQAAQLHVLEWQKAERLRALGLQAEIEGRQRPKEGQ